MRSPQSPRRPTRAGTTYVPRKGPPLTSLPSSPRLPRLKQRPVEPPPSKWQTTLFALVLLLLFSGLLAGWGYSPLVYFSLLATFSSSANQVQDMAPVNASSNATSTGQQAANKASDRVYTILTPTVQITPSAVSSSASRAINTLPVHSDTGMHLDIPTIGVSLPLETVGVTNDGSLDMPLLHQWNGAGIYKQGTLPGNVGSAVIDGYQSHPDGSPAAFARLATLHIGDDVSVWRTDGTILHFHVLSVQSYTSDQAPISTIFSDTSGKYLNLIAVATNGGSAASQSGRQIVVHTALD